MNKYTITFREFLTDLSDHSDIGMIYSRLFSLKTDEELERILKHYHEIQKGTDEFYGEYGKENWFSEFIVSLRKTDFFNNCYQKVGRTILKSEERKRMVQLRDIFNDKTKTYEEREAIREARKEEYHEYLSLRQDFQRESEDENIGGHLDMILRDTIYLDKKDCLRRVFLNLFEEAEEGFPFCKKPKRR